VRFKDVSPSTFIVEMQEEEVYNGVQKTATASSQEGDELILLFHIPF
jgi:Icc-related predicted phosphoesterase